MKTQHEGGREGHYVGDCTRHKRSENTSTERQSIGVGDNTGLCLDW